MKRLKLGGVMLASAVLSLVAAACGGEDATPTRPPAPTATRAPATSPTAVPTATRPPAPTATARPVPTGALRIAVANLANHSFDPKGGIDTQFNEPIYDDMVGYTAVDGQLDPTRGFATSWTSNANATEWTFRLRNNITFHSGEKATSADAKFTMQYQVRENFPAGAAAALRKLLGPIETPDDSTLVVKLTAPDIFFPLANMTSLASAPTKNLLPKAYTERVGEGGFEKAPVGSGPYKVREINIGTKFTYEALNEHWFVGVPRYKTIEFNGIPEQGTRVALLKSGGAEIAEINRASAPDITKSGLKVFTKNSSAVAYINFNQQWDQDYGGVKNPLSIKEVRQALSLAIDRQTIVDTFMYGQAKVSSAYPIVSWDPAYKANPSQAFDRAKARQMLRDAGYPNGFTLDYRMFAFPGLPEGLEIGEAIAVGWETAGIKVNRLPSEYNAYQDSWFTQKFKAPTAGGPMYIANRINATVLAKGTSTKESAARLTEDPELNTLANAYGNAPAVDEFVKRGQAFEQAFLDKTIAAVLFEGGATFGAASSVPSTWQLGKAPYSMNLTQLAKS